VWSGRPRPPISDIALAGEGARPTLILDLYLFAVPRASFFTLRFCDPRAYSRGLSGCSVLRFLRAVRFSFLRSSLLSAVVFAMITNYSSFKSLLYRFNLNLKLFQSALERLCQIVLRRKASDLLVLAGISSPCAVPAGLDHFSFATQGLCPGLTIFRPSGLVR
jgi:hypothetical protein